ncbi:MAG TPA: DsbA family protein [Thermoleophilaceae bacterium]|nr:DsbA family protein [Thermoleophilaceae bacterium]
MNDLEAARRQRRWLIGASVAVAAAIVVAAIAIGGAGGGEAGTTTGRPAGRTAVGGLFGGIPQQGIQLGSPSAPVTVTEFADLQCPYCGESARDELPAVVTRFVRPGRVRLVFRNLAFLGPDSLRGARVVAAAALQNRLWQMVDLVYRNQGEENSGWLNDAYLRRVATAAGVEPKRAFAERASVAARAQLDEARRMAKAAGVSSTPTFVIARGGREVERVTGAGELEAALAKAVNGS